MIAILCLALIAAVNCSPLSEVEAEWQAYKAQYRQNYYADAAEEAFRRTVFENTYNIIAQHNKEADAGLHTWRMGVNEFSDLTDEEFIARYTTPGIYDMIPRNESNLHVASGEPLADSVDWRTKNVVTHVKNQGQCGSCFAFSAVDTVETQHAISTGKLVELSPQQIVDCYGGDVCQTGGLPTKVYDVIKSEGGIEPESAYPYTGKHGTCRFAKASAVATVGGYKSVAAQESALIDAIANVGTISVCVAAGNTAFKNYKSGILKDSSCPNTARSLDHAIVAVGYTADALIVKNSWGTSWGESGYIRLARGVNECGVDLQTAYPTTVG